MSLRFTCLRCRESLRLALSLYLVVAAFGDSGRAQGQDDAVVAEEEVVVGDDAPEVAEEAPSAKVAWDPPMIAARERDGQAYWQRQSSDAFTDPDQRLGLVPKYLFVLPQTTAEVPGNMRRGPTLEAGSLALKSGIELPALARLLPWPDNMTNPPGLSAQWLDYDDGPKAKLLALLTPPAEQDSPALLCVARLAAPGAGGARQIERIAAQREIPAAELVPDALPGGTLDTLDRPAEYGSRKTLLGRVIAVLKRIGDQYAVDFTGENLHADSDCRVWLSPVEHELGRPIAVRFVPLPIERESGQIAPIIVLSVRYRDRTDQLHTVAFDYPLCSSPLMVQLRKLAEQAKPAGQAATENQSSDQATALLGEELAEEMSRRLVNGVYR